MYGINEKIYIIGLIVIFITVVLGGMFGVQLASIWLKFKREEMRSEREKREVMQEVRWEQERDHWVGIVKDQNKRIDALSDELVKLSRDYENAKNLMSKVNLKGETINVQ